MNCDHCGEYGDSIAHASECPIELRSEIALWRSRLRKEEESHAQTCRLSDEWFAKLAAAKRLGLEAAIIADGAVTIIVDASVDDDNESPRLKRDLRRILAALEAL